MHGNRLVRNGVGAFLPAASGRNVFAGNVFDDNLVQVYEDHGGDNQWSDEGRGNWWSDYGGFDWNRDGLGDSPYRLQSATSALLAPATWSAYSSVNTIR